MREQQINICLQIPHAASKKVFSFLLAYGRLDKVREYRVYRNKYIVARYMCYREEVTNEYGKTKSNRAF